MTANQDFCISFGGIRSEDVGGDLRTVFSDRDATGIEAAVDRLGGDRSLVTMSLVDDPLGVRRTAVLQAIGADLPPNKHERHILLMFGREIEGGSQSGGFEPIKEALRVSQERSRSIIDFSPMGMHLYQLQDDGRLVFVAANSAADQILGVDNSQFVGKTIEEAFPPLAETEIPERYRNVCMSGEPWKTEQVFYQDDQIDGAYEVHAFRIEEHVMTAMFSDITKRRVAEEALRAHFEFERLISRVSARLLSVPSEQLASAVETVLREVCTFARADGAFVLVSEEDSSFSVRSTWHNNRISLRRDLLSELNPDSFLRTPGTFNDSQPIALSMSATDDLEKSPRNDVLKEQEIDGLLGVPMVFGDETRGVVCLARAEPSRSWSDDNRALLSLLGQILNNVLQRARAENELSQAKDDLEDRVRERTAELQAANRELEAFAYSVSHDLRAPLRSVEGFSRMLIRDIPNTIEPRARDSVERIHQAAGRMSAMIEGLLQLSRTAQAAMEISDVDLSLLARATVDELASSEPERDVDCVVQPELVMRGDGRLLALVLQNLIGNAWKFTSSQKKGRIEFYRPEESSSGKGTSRESAQIVLCVRDNGIGFNMNYAETLFTPFGRLHDAADFPGTGIGLATVQRVIHRHGGRVWAEAEPDKGAAFYFSLPQSDLVRTPT
ncbi:MAG: GAF domain-containing protein [bacterium]|nr:GAF domain-containing protein [bacterium]